MKHTFWHFVSSQWATTPPVPRDDLTGKTVVVIGANVGLGFEAAKHFASMNPGILIIGCRDKQRGEDALQQIQQATGCKNVQLWLIDLKDHASVSMFAERFEKENLRLDIVVANAAVVPSSKKPEAGPDGWEVAFLINNLSTNLLCLLLLPRLLKTAKEHNTLPRLVVVSSGMHYRTKLGPRIHASDHPVRSFGHVDDIEATQYTISKRYQDTKLLNVFFVRALNEKLRNQPLITDAVCPGYCSSNLRRNMGGFLAVASWIMELCLARTTEAGSRQLVWAALGMQDDPDKLRGAYISSMEITEPSDYVMSQAGAEIQDKLWDDMLEELEKINPKVREIATTYLAT